MKMIVFVALLAAAGCSKKSSSECEASIGQGIENLAPKVKTGAADPQIHESKLERLTKVKVALIQRCTTDKWAPEVVACFATVSSLPAMQMCQAKLTSEQHTRLNEDIREIEMSSMGGRMPGGHPSTLSGSGGPGASGGSAAAPAGSAADPAGSAAAPAPAGSAAPEPAAGSNAK